MPTILGPAYPPDWDGTPKRMSKEDFALWKIYRETELNGVIALYFDVLLGKGQDAGEGYTDEEKQFWREKTQLRADVVIEYDDKVKLVELRANASVSTIGRVDAYMLLMNDDNPLGKPLEAEIVTNTQQQIVSDIAKRRKIKYT